jgi:hypothetical protein
LAPAWKEPQSLTATIEGAIAHQQAIARAAEARYAEITRDAIPGTNPNWGGNRLRKELSDRGYIYKMPARGQGLILANPATGDRVRIMQRPERPPHRQENRQKFYNDYYYRYMPSGGGWGAPITIPNKR